MHLHNRDVVKLGKELDSIWNDAVRLGKHFDEDLKKSTLYHCTAQDWFYANSVDALKTAKPDCKYNEAYHALAKKQQDGEISSRIRGAARIAASGEQWDANQGVQVPRGRRDPRNPMAPQSVMHVGDQIILLAIAQTTTTLHQTQADPLLTWHRKRANRGSGVPF